MAEHERDVFLPEEVDVQIDAYLATSTTHEQPLDTSALNAVQALQHHLAPSQQDAALQRVWQRFEQERATIRHRESAMQHTIIPQKRRYRMKHTLSERLYKERSTTRPAHYLSLVATVMMVALLVGCMIVVFRLAPKASTHPSVAGQPAGSAEKEMFVLVNGTTLSRLDINTHQPLWHFQAPDGESIPFLGEAVNDTYYVRSLKALYALDAANGKVRWHVDASAGLENPLITNDTAYLSAGSAAVEALNRTNAVEALNRANGAVKWQHHLDSPSLIAASDTAVYGETFGNSPERFALNAQNGNLLWQKNEEIANSDAGMDIGGGFVVDGVLVVTKSISGTNQAFLVGYNATSGEKLWSKSLTGFPPMDGTTVLKGIIYLSTINTAQKRGNTVYAFSVKDGALIWQYDDPDVTGSTYPTVTEEGVYIVRYGLTAKGSKPTLVALDTRTGKVRWTHNNFQEATLEYPPAADAAYLYVSLPDNMVQILRASDGKAIGSFQVNGKVIPRNGVLVQVVD